MISVAQRFGAQEVAERTAERTAEFVDPPPVVETDRLVLIGESAIKIALQAPGVAAHRVGLEMLVGFKPNSVLDVGQCSLALQLPGECLGVVSSGIPWRKPKPFVEIGKSAIEIAQLRPQQAPGGVSPRQFRIEAKGLIVVCHRAIEFPLVLPGVAAAAVDDGIPWR